jgi:hypothetical protein
MADAKHQIPGTALIAPSTKGLAPHRPSLYTPEIADVILRRLSDGETLREICRTPGMPDDRTVRGWALDDREGFAAVYARARMIGGYAMGDDLLKIADDSKGDMTTDADGRPIVNHENINRSRLRVDTRKWLLSKVLPRVFGDKVELTGPGGGALSSPVFNIAFVSPAANDGQS